MLNIIVCIKQTPNTDRIKFDWKKGSIIRPIAENIMNPDDQHALELALQIRSKYEANITAITLGPKQAEEILREAYSLGVDHGILISDERFAGSDTLITSKILYKAIQKSGNYDIIITGFETIDGNTSQVSYQLSELLDIPHLTQIHEIDIKENIATINRLFGHEYQKIQVSLPILIATKRTSNQVRYPRLKDIKHSFEKEIEILTMDDLEMKEQDIGHQGSPSITIEGEVFSHKRKQVKFEGTIDEKIDQLIHKLKKYEILKM
jgi:electron transfer flavoprotein alpha/beta subunit